jgi:hypothetical protein
MLLVTFISRCRWPRGAARPKSAAHSGAMAIAAVAMSRISPSRMSEAFDRGIQILADHFNSLHSGGGKCGILQNRLQQRYSLLPSDFLISNGKTR